MADSVKVALPESAERRWVVSDYHAGDHVPYPDVFRDPVTDEPGERDKALRQALRRAGVVDGDEVIIMIEKTGRRPYGEVRLVRRMPMADSNERPLTDSAKLGLVVVLPNEPGALSKFLSALRTMNLTRIDGKSIAGSPGQAAFFVEVEAVSYERFCEMCETPGAFLGVL